MDARVGRVRERGERQLGLGGVGEAGAGRTRPRSARRPRPPARRPSRRRPRTAASGRAASPRWRAAGARCRCPRTARRRAASQSTSKANSLSPMRTRSPGCSGRGRLQQLLVEVGAVGRAEILEHDDAALLVDARVARGGEGVLEADLGLLAAPEHEVAVEVVDHPGLVAGCALDDEPRRAVGDVGAAERRGRVQAGARRRGIAPARLRRTPVGAAARRGDPGARCGRPTAGTGRGRRGSRTSARPIPAASVVHRSSKTISVEPSSMRSPGVQRLATANRLAVDEHAVGGAEVLDRPALGGRADLGVVAGDAGVVEHDVAVAAAADRSPPRAAAAGGGRRRAAARAAGARRGRPRRRPAHAAEVL